MSAFPAMWQFAGVYLNQDWPDDYGSWEAAVDAFVVESPTYAQQLPDEIARALREIDSEPELEAFLDGQGASYAARSADGGYRALLTKIAERVSRALDG